MAKQGAPIQVHAGWETGTDGESLWRTMGYRPEDGEPEAPSPRNKGDDQETEAAVCGAFKRNLLSTPTATSQYGYTHVTWALTLPVLAEEALGTAKAKDILRKEAAQAMNQLAPTHPVAVWRIWPSIERCSATNRLRLYMRLHVMTEAAYQGFAQQEPL